VALALAVTLVPTAACRKRAKPKAKAGPLAVQSFALPNGLKVDLVDGQCGTDAGVALLFEIGADHDPAGRSGLTTVVQVALGAKLPTWMVESGLDHTGTAATVPVAGVDGAVDLAAGRMGTLGLVDAELAQQLKLVSGVLARRRGDDPMLTAMSYAVESVQPSRGGGWSGGVVAEVEALTLADVDAYWAAHWKPANARLVVVGHVDPTALRAHIETAFGALPAGTKPVLRPPADSTVSGTLVMGDAPTAIAIAVPAPAPTAPTFPAFLILAARGGKAITYDPLTAPETLYVSGPMAAGEAPDAAAARLRAGLAELPAPPVTAEDVRAVEEKYGTFLGVGAAEPTACAKDPRTFALAWARRAQLGLDGAAVTKALAATTPAQLAEAARAFDPKRTAAVAAGGTIR